MHKAVGLLVIKWWDVMQQWLLLVAKREVTELWQQNWIKELQLSGETYS